MDYVARMPKGMRDICLRIISNQLTTREKGEDEEEFVKVDLENVKKSFWFATQIKDENIKRSNSLFHIN